MTTARKLFSETITLPTLGPTRLSTMMATAGWGFEMDSNNAITTIPSLDSTVGTGITLIPATNTIWVGSDQYVRDVANTGPPRTYAGVTATPAIPYAIEEASKYAIVDINEIWIWNPGPAQDIQVVFKGR